MRVRPGRRHTPARTGARDLGAALPDETADLRPSRDDGRLERLLAWAPADGTVTVFDRACRPLRVARNERSLDGDVHVKAIVRGRTKTVSGDTIELGWDVTLVCGFDVTYERNASGRWVETASGATGCADTVGHALSEVTDTAAWWGGASVAVAVKCGHRREEVQRCLDGSERTCATCERLAIELDSPEGRFHTASAVTAVRIPAGAGPVDCALLCPADARGAKIAAANAALAGADLEQVGLEKHPTLFRTRAACRAYRARHAIPASELATW